MRISTLALLLACACGGMPPSSSDAGCPTPHEVDAGPPPPVVVAIRWTRFTADPHPCGQPPSCTVGCDVCMDGRAIHWGCPTCASGTAGGCATQTALSMNCCARSATIEQASLQQLVRDYPSCALSQTSPGTYALECGMEPMPQFGAMLAFTGDGGCDWNPPYAIH